MFFMRKVISKLLLLPFAFTMFYCANEPIAPREPGENLADSKSDERTSSSMRAYSRNLFVIEVSARKYGPSEPLPAPFEMWLAGTDGTISINWGDGAIETATLTPGDFGGGSALTHQYSHEQNYVIKISGDIKNIFRYDISNQEIGLNNIHLSGLSGLRFLGINFTKSAPEVINLFHNRLIEDVDLIDIGNVSGIVQPDIDVIIPATNNINHIRLFGTNLTTQSVDQVIDRIYKSVVKSPRPGTFGLSLSWAQPDDSDDMVGPPSGYSIDKLRILRDSYGWTLNPDFDNN
jgi:hypothetical protein